MPTHYMYSSLRLALTTVIWCAAAAFAQSPARSATAVPRLVKYSGTLVDSAGKSLTGTLGVTFSLYAEAEGGAPIWMENQNVEADANGQFTVLLGFTKSDGIPVEAFGGGPRWLGIHVQGEAERPRVLIASVPYSLKAVDAETLGGLPASAFALAGSGSHGAAAELAGAPGAPGPRDAKTWVPGPPIILPSGRPLRLSGTPGCTRPAAVTWGWGLPRRRLRWRRSRPAQPASRLWDRPLRRRELISASTGPAPAPRARE